LLVAFAVQHEPQREFIYEEAWSIERFPEYAFYRARTPRRFVPWRYWSLAPSSSCSVSTRQAGVSRFRRRTTSAREIDRRLFRLI
jgi:hypothetical protein